MTVLVTNKLSTTPACKKLMLVVIVRHTAGSVMRQCLHVVYEVIWHLNKWLLNKTSPSNLALLYTQKEKRKRNKRNMTTLNDSAVFQSSMTAWSDWKSNYTTQPIEIGQTEPLLFEILKWLSLFSSYIPNIFNSVPHKWEWFRVNENDVGQTDGLDRQNAFANWPMTIHIRLDS